MAIFVLQILNDYEKNYDKPYAIRDYVFDQCAEN